MKTSKKLFEDYVKESNAIENIFVRKNHHLFVDHLKATEFVVSSALGPKVPVMPESIHAILMRRELSDAGKLRKVRVWVNLDLKPYPENIEKLVKSWKRSLQKNLQNSISLVMPSQAEDFAWHYHHWFESIHPFMDGNGRTGRLILNNIRLLVGLPWLIIPFSEREQYYESIRKWELEHKDLLSEK